MNLPIAGVGFAIAIFFSTLPAQADYRLCNETSYVLEAAVAQQDVGVWVSEGWFRIDPGDCVVAIQGAVDTGPYFLYAQSHTAHAGAQREFSGSTPFCTVREDFLIEESRRYCALRGYDSRDFYRVDTKAGKDWTTSFTSVGYDLEKARVAGVERLLAELKLSNSRVDGVLNSDVRDAIRKFRADHGVPGEATDIDAALYDTLLGEVELKNGERGLTLCNETMNLIWSAIGRELDDSVRSSGWYEVQVGECTQVVRGSLPSKAVYYLYADAVDDVGAMQSWSGNYPFCTKKSRFTIEGREDCQKRGGQTKQFLRLDSGQRSSFTYTLKDQQ